MKKLLFGLLAVAVLAMTSCSKEARINKRLDGEWKATTINGNAVQSGEDYTMVFSKSEKNSGTGTTSYSGSAGSYTYAFTYTLSENLLTMVSTILGQESTETVTIDVYEKDKIEWTDSDGKKTVLEPK